MLKKIPFQHKPKNIKQVTRDQRNPNSTPQADVLTFFPIEVGVGRITISDERATPQTTDRPSHPDADDHPLRLADKATLKNHSSISKQTKHLTTDVFLLHAC